VEKACHRNQFVLSLPVNILLPPHSYSRHGEQKYSSRYVHTVVSTALTHAPAV